MYCFVITEKMVDVCRKILICSMPGFNDAAGANFFNADPFEAVKCIYASIPAISKRMEPCKQTV